MASGDRWFFDRIARVYDRLMPPAKSRELRRAIGMADGPVERVLDVGGGTGRASRAFDGADRVVVDISRGMLGQVPPDIGRVLASATDLPVAEGLVDAVVVVDALHHMPTHDRVVREGHRVLRPGGVFVVQEFDRSTLRGRVLEWVEHAIRMDSTFATAGTLHSLLEAAGFETWILDRGFSCTVVGRKPVPP